MSFNGIANNTPRVFVFSDINIDSGDPDDRQSLIHLLWYANQLKIEGIVPDRWNANGFKACELVIEAYEKDYREFSFEKSDYPKPSALDKIIARDTDDAFRLFSKAASDTSSPLYVLVWGNMEVFNGILLKNPEFANNIRLITIGTGLMLEDDIQGLPAEWKKSPPCEQLNWNGFGRAELFNAGQFNDMWWLEINWTYAGMFSGEEPKQMFDKLTVFGKLGAHIREVVKNESWAQYFRVGDTPSVLFIIDPSHNLDNPSQSSWAGKFYRPFPQVRPNYFTDFNGTVEWDYSNPCNTWQNHRIMRNVAMKTLEVRRAEMYHSLLEKLTLLYNK